MTPTSRQAYYIIGQFFITDFQCFNSSFFLPNTNIISVNEIQSNVSIHVHTSSDQMLPPRLPFPVVNLSHCFPPLRSIFLEVFVGRPEVSVLKILRIYEVNKLPSIKLVT